MNYYQKLFDYMYNEHGVTLLEQDMQEICLLVSSMQRSEIDIEEAEAYTRTHCPYPSKTQNAVDWKNGFERGVNWVAASNGI